MAHLFDLKEETTSPDSLGELEKSPLRRRTPHSLECVRRTGELQERFDFGKKAKREPEWPFISSASPERYPAILQRAALMALHRLSRPHAIELCVYCKRETARNAA